MQLEQRPRLQDGKIPVFVFPTELVFYADNRSTHKQVLTVYNPYDFPFKFKVLCTAPRKYNVVDSEGTVRPGCCIDILIRLKELSETGFGQRDKFRLNLYQHGHREVIGRKDVSAVLLATAQGRDQDSEDASSQLSTPSAGSLMFSNVNRGRAGPGATVVLVAILCIIALMLPTQGEKDSRLPDYLHLTVNQKLIAAYVLGLVTMVLLRT